MRALVLPLLVLAACRPPSPLEKQPYDFPATPAPALSAFGSEGTLAARWGGGAGDDLLAFWDGGVSGTLTGVDGVQLVYRAHVPAGAKAAVVLVPGRTEAIIKYAEVAQDLFRQGYATYAITLRGQGEAGRMLPDREKGHVAWFDDYVTDTHRFITELVKPHHGKVFMLAHSLGGAVAVLLADQYPEDLQALALSAPMLDINTGFPPFVSASLATGVCDTTDGTDWSLGSGGYKQETDFSKNTVTGSEARWTWKVAQLTADPSIRLGGTTWRFVCQALIGSTRASRVGRYSELPTLLLQPGADTIVQAPGQDAYCADAPRCVKVALPGSKHELLQEVDAIRNLALSRIVYFFDDAVTP